MAKRIRKQDQSPTILKFFRLASPKEDEGSCSEEVNSAESETRPNECSGGAESTATRPAADTTACVTSRS